MCHNNQDTPASLEWYDGNTTACTMCHTAGGTDAIPDNIHPNSGLHNVTPTVSEKTHDDTLGTGCTNCHTMPAVAPASTHINGTAVIDGSSNTDRGLFGDYTDAAAGTCSGSPGTVGDTGVTTAPARRAAGIVSGARRPRTATGPRCANCHGGVDGVNWAYDGSQAGSVEHDKDWDAAQSSSDGAEVIGNHSGNTDQTDRCDYCHVYPNTPYDATPDRLGGRRNGHLPRQQQDRHEFHPHLQRGDLRLCLQLPR